jgi:predicted DNA binding protein
MKSRKVHNMPVLNGEIHPLAKLTAAQVRTIRQTYEPGRVTMFDLAERYGVSKQAISSIINRLSWHHLPHEGPGGPALVAPRPCR